jgi:hypothetical protein
MLHRKFCPKWHLDFQEWRKIQKNIAGFSVKINLILGEVFLVLFLFTL